MHRRQPRAAGPPAPDARRGRRSDAAAVEVEAKATASCAMAWRLTSSAMAMASDALGLHELQPRRGGEEQVAHLHPRAVRAGEGARARRRATAPAVHAIRA